MRNLSDIERERLDVLSGVRGDAEQRAARLHEVYTLKGQLETVLRRLNILEKLEGVRTGSDGVFLLTEFDSNILRLNKSAISDTASVQLSTSNNAQADIGIIGDNDLVFNTLGTGGMTERIRIKNDGDIEVPGTIEGRDIAADAAAQDATHFLAARYGATGDGVTDDSIAIQNAIDAAETAGGGAVILGYGTFIVTGITLKSGVYLKGQGPVGTILRMNTGSNATVVRSNNFSTLTGTTSWYIGADGVPYHFGLSDLAIDGNRANNTTGSGIEFFGKRFVAHNLLIYDCAEHGFWSECGNKTGQTHAYYDQPECQIGEINIRTCGKDGFHFEGPHDGHISAVASSNCGWRCIAIVKGTNSAGTCDVGWIHGYGGGKDVDTSGTYVANYPAVLFDATVRADTVVAESGGTHAFHVGTNGANSQVGVLRAFEGNRLAGGSPCVLVDGSYVAFADFRIDRENNGGGLEITSQGFRGKGIIQADAGATSTGLKVSASNCFIDAHIRSFSGTGGVGLETASGNRSKITGTIINCKTGWNNSATGTEFNRYDLAIQIPSGGTRFTGNGPGTAENWDVSAEIDNGSGRRYSRRKALKPATTVNLNSTSVQTISFNHTLLDGLTPPIESIRVTLANPSIATNFAVDYIIVTAVTSTQITVKVKLGTATGVAGTCDLSVECAV